MSYILSEEAKKQYFERAIAKIQENHHEYVSGTYENKNSVLIVFCLIHSKECKTTFTNYCPSKTGTNCCGKKRVSDKLTNRKYSPETIKKMSEAASARIRPKTAGQDWRRTFEARQWEKEIDQIWKNECAISGTLEAKLLTITFDLVRHHFFSSARYKTDTLPLRSRYNSQNGILIHKVFHKDFHSKFGDERNDIIQFQSYIKSLETLIRSQIQHKCWKGSETRVNTPFSKKRSFQTENRNENVLDLEMCLERVIKLHERLEKTTFNFLDL
uniref:putative HNH homing endonuclease n=1 Tax=Kalinella pachyderma TaxID=2704665 RepID=UPI0024115F1A|nr:putative HNH homing endonuclease [Kalinella pachyderma]WDY12865.1 putative HNH homing endonuclease [Kalinella pachyderma]